MANDSDTGPTPGNVADLATTSARMDRLALVGVFGTSDTPGALLRMDNGDMKRVRVGDIVDGNEVLGIGDNRVALRRRGKTHVLSLPRI